MKDIYEIIINDLRNYGQENSAPKSLTIEDGENWRHYELGECFGLVAYGEGHVLITEIKEDDENWFCFSGSDKDQFDASWIKTKVELYNRMQEWLGSNLTRGYYSGHDGKEGFECGYKNRIK